MDDLAEEAEEGLVISVREIETWIVENPVILPVVVIDPVLPDVTCSVLEASIRRGKARQIKEPGEETRLLEAAAPVDSLDLDGVDNVPPSDLGDSHGSGLPPRGLT